MKAMLLKQIGAPLEWTELPDRQPGTGEIRVKVAACGVCRTDQTTSYPLKHADQALADLRAGRFKGAAVLVQ